MTLESMQLLYLYLLYRPHVSDSGSADLSVSSVSLSVSVVVGQLLII